MWADILSPRALGYVASIRHKVSGYYFRFDNTAGAAEYSPGRDSVVAKVAFAGGWSVQLNNFVEWTNYLRRELHEPDLWSSVSAERLLLEAASAPDSDNRPFTAEERAGLLGGVEQIREHLRKTEATDSARWDFIEGQLLYLIEASNRMGRKDWLNVVISVMTQLAFQLPMAPAAARALFRLAGEAFQWLTGHALLPP